MSFTMDALQSRSRRETQHDQEKKVKRDETIITTMGQVAKGIADTVSSVIKNIWPNSNDLDDKQMPRSNNNPVVKDVMIDVDAMIVYDQPIENGEYIFEINIFFSGSFDAYYYLLLLSI